MHLGGKEDGRLRGNSFPLLSSSPRPMSPRTVFLVGFLLLSTSTSPRPSSAETSTCLTVYKEGGAPAVFQSPKCPRWNLFPDDRRGRPVYNCQVAVHQGRRRSQEDRAVCAIDVRIPFVGVSGVRDVTVGIVAVFDGHNGAEASEMASKLLLEYFFLHVHFLLDGLYSATLTRPIQRLVYDEALDMFSQEPAADVGRQRHNFDLERYQWILPRIFDSDLHLEILKESLLRTIHDIDATFSKEAFRKNFHSGSTATVVLIADGQILAVNVGDSKAILCSESFDPPHDLKGNALRLSRSGRRNRAFSPTKKYENPDAVTTYQQKYIHVKELTRDHHPDRDDEKNRVEAAGGFVDWLGVPRVNGVLAVSRAIGDVSLKSYGVIPTPEVTDWQPLGCNDSYLIVATDGVFDKLTTQDTCDLLWDANTQGDVNPEFIFTVAHSLADYIVQTAFERGTIDNLAAVVVPLRLPGIPNTQIKDSRDAERRKGTSYSGAEKFEYIKSGKDGNNSSLISVEYFNQITTNFNRLVVETNSKKLGCFYLSENLNDNKDYDFLQAKDYQKTRVHDPSTSLFEALRCNHNAGAKRLYNDHTFCSLFELDLGVKDLGNDLGNFEKFLGLLDSFPYNGTGFDSTNPLNFKVPDFRYTLERQFGGGSYGEVWLAFQWNCSEVGGNFSCQHEKLNCFGWDVHAYNTSQRGNSSPGYYCSDVDDDNSYILKRIKVEKGNVAYRSGLREKYFGEMFLKAFLSHGGFITTSTSSSSIDVGCTSCGTLQLDEHDPLEMSYAYSCNGATYEGLRHIARFVEYFESPSEGIWLVFRNEGLSLKKLLYSEVGKVFSDIESDVQVKKPQIFHPSSWWHWLRTTETGRREMRNLILQLLLALKACHVRNITHRDIKPENMIICFEDTSTGRCLKRIPSGGNDYHLRIRLIDFGSAIDKFTLTHLYGSGPTRSEQTFAYTPPEALLNASWFQAPDDVAMKYDMWSVGVFMVELILGSPNIFETSARTRALIYQQLEGWSGDIKELAYKLHSYVDMCIIIPGIFPKYHFQDHDELKCSEESFLERIKHRDPLKLGFPNIRALRLVHQLLVWQPEERLSVDEALQHPYFHYDT